MSFFDLIAAVDRTVQRLLGGEPVVYRPEVGEPVPVTGIFDQQYVLAQGDAHAGVSTLVPAVFLLLADLPVDPDEDEPTLTIRGVNYHMVKPMPDGAGGIVLALRKVT